VAHTFVKDVLICDLIKLDTSAHLPEPNYEDKNFHNFLVANDNQIIRIVTTNDLVKICSVSYNSKIRRICDEILTRMEKK